MSTASSTANVVNLDDLMTTEEVCALAGISVRGLKLRVADGRAPPPFRIGKTTRFYRSQMVPWAKAYRLFTKRYPSAQPPVLTEDEME